MQHKKWLLAVATTLATALAASPASAGNGAPTLSAGEQLTAGQQLISPNRAYRLIMQTDGNLVLYGGNTVYFHTRTTGRNGAYVRMQTDGNLVVYQGSTALWDSGTSGQGGAGLRLQDDANAVLYRGSVALWASRPGSNCPNPSSQSGVPIGDTAIGRHSNIRVHKCLVHEIDALTLDSRQAGLSLTGTGWRSRESQEQLRRQNCSGGVYDPNAYCNPKTAVPGTSVHEDGLAIDFSCSGALIRTRNACFNWLSANGRSYALINFPEELWHWSTNGR